MQESLAQTVSVTELLLQLELAQATELARAGRYAEAETVLTDLLNARELPAALDLQARIHAQQGRLSKARECWKRALQLDPGNDAYAAGLLRLKSSQGSSDTPFLQQAVRIAASVSKNDLLLGHQEGDGWHYEVVPGYMIRNQARGGGCDYLLYRLARHVGDYVEANGLGVITLSQAGYEVTSPGEQTTVWVPDLAFVRAERVPAANSQSWLRPWKLVPDLVVEIVSGQQDVDQLAYNWLERGVRLLWIIWPGSRVIDVWQPGVQEKAPVRVKEKLDGLDVIPGFTCSLEELFGTR